MPDKTLKEISEEQLNSPNPGQIGDPTSLKAEGSAKPPKKSEEGAKSDDNKSNATSNPAKSGSGSGGAEGRNTAGNEHKTLKQVAQETNPSMLGDPVSLKAEKANSEPTSEDRGALKEKKQGRQSKI